MVVRRRGTAVDVARDVDDYVAQEAGRDSRLFDTARTTRALETAYLAMAEQYRRGAIGPIEVAEA